MRMFKMTFELAACAEMLWLDKPIDWRASRLKELGFGVGLWNWPDHDIDALAKTGARFTIMNGYLEGRLADDEGAGHVVDVLPPDRGDCGGSWLPVRTGIQPRVSQAVRRAAGAGAEG